MTWFQFYGQGTTFYLQSHLWSLLSLSPSAIHPKSIAHGNHTIVHSELSTSSNVYIKEKYLPSFRQIQGGWMVMHESTNTKQVQRLSALFRTTEMASSSCSVGTVHL